MDRAEPLAGRTACTTSSNGQRGSRAAAQTCPDFTTRYMRQRAHSACAPTAALGAARRWAMNHILAAVGSGSGRVGSAHQGRKRWAVPTLRLGRLVSIALVALCVGQASLATAAGVVGSGTPESCTEAALDAALAGGGLVTFNCGNYGYGWALTITIASTKMIAQDSAIDGSNGGRSPIILSGGNTVTVFRVNAGVNFPSTTPTVSGCSRNAAAARSSRSW